MIPINVRQNNPGNMRGKTGAFQTFQTPDDGLEAMKRDLLLKVSGQSNAMAGRYGQGYQPTLANLITTWAPPEENDTQSYINFVSQKSGLNPNQVLTHADVDRIIPAMIEQEGGEKAASYYNMSPSQKEPQNFFDQFDAPQTTGGNFFDQFDSPALKSEAYGPKAPQEKGFFERVGDKFDKRNKDLEAASYNPDFVGGNAGLMYNAIGQTLQKGLLDVPSEALTSVNKAIPQSVKDFGADVYTGLKNDPVSHLPVRALELAGGILSEASQGYDKFKRNHPTAGLYLDSTAGFGNAALSTVPVKGQSVPSRAVAPAGRATEKVGDALYKSGEAAFKKKRDSFLQDLITPKEIPTVKAELFSRSKERGLLRSRVVEPSPQELSIMETVSSLPVTKNKSLAANYNIIKDANLSEADALIIRLNKSTVVIPEANINSAFQSVLGDLSKSPYLTTDSASEAVKRVIAIAQDQIKGHPNTPAGILQARKAFDKEVGRYKKNVFDPATASPVTDAVQGVRQAMNDVVAAAVPDAGVKQSLAKQSNMYRAMDSIETKGGWEGKNIVSRTAEKVGNLIPVKGALAKTGLATVGIGGAAMAPALAAGAGGLYLAGKAITSPTLRKAAGSAIKGVGKATRADLKDIMRLPPKQAKAALEELKISEPQRLLPSPEKMSAIPMSEQEIAISKARISGGQRPVSTDPSGTQVIRPPASQMVKLQEGLGRKRGAEFNDLVQIFKDGDMSQNQFMNEVVRKFGLNTTQARSLAKEIKTYE